MEGSVRTPCVAITGRSREVITMRHDKYLAYAAAGMPLDEILTHFERDLILFLATIEDEFEEVYAEGDGL